MHFFREILKKFWYDVIGYFYSYILHSLWRFRIKTRKKRLGQKKSGSKLKTRKKFLLLFGNVLTCFSCFVAKKEPSLGIMELPHNIIKKDSLCNNSIP